MGEEAEKELDDFILNDDSWLEESDEGYQKCPECGSDKVREVSSGSFDDEKMGGVSWSTFLCEECLHSWTEV